MLSLRFCIDSQVLSLVLLLTLSLHIAVPVKDDKVTASVVNRSFHNDDIVDSCVPCITGGLPSYNNRHVILISVKSIFIGRCMHSLQTLDSGDAYHIISTKPLNIARSVL